ncbi:MAG: tyrosine-type recombinase/integrase [Chlorobium sp.]|nr:tyrosine-type recombinase/integrase [Chlorobium sp.]
MAKENTFKFTEDRLRSLPLPDAGKREYYNDTTEKGLRLAVSGTGVKSFQFQRWSKEKHRPVIITLGKWDDLPLHSAREKAAELKVSVNAGNDPQSDKRAKRDTMLVGEMLDIYLEEHSKPRNRTWEYDAAKIEMYLKPAFGKKPITDVTTDMVRAWHNKTKREFSDATANRRLALLRVAFNRVVPDIVNPCRSVKVFKETPQERYLKQDELERLFEALGALRSEGDIDNVDYVELSLLTGARQANVLAMRWNDLDLNFNQWRVPGDEAKGKKTLTVALSADAIAILERRKETASSVFVFPSHGKSGHLQEPFKGWQRILKCACIEDCRLHDLRHTLATYQNMTGAPESVIGKTLGHQNVETTRRYTHMAQNTVLESVEKAVARMKTPVEKKVVNIQK